jgi:broad specificity phosphatase PhoE
MRLHIIRHGDPDYALDSLTERGRREAEALREWVVREAPDRAYHSPMGRARLTAEIALQGSGLTASCEPWTAELSPWGPVPGAAVSLAYWDQHGHAIRSPAFLDSLQPEVIEGIAVPDFLANLPRIATDSDDFLARHGLVRDGGAYRVSPCDSQSIAVFCHMGFGLTWLAHLLALPTPLVWCGFHLHTTSVTTLLFDEREPGIATPRALWVGDITHLNRAGIEPSRMGIKANYR